MTQKKFHHSEIILPNPQWGSGLATKIIELEKLRERRFVPYSFDLFWELKSLFQYLENWASARIEGNQTKLVDALDPAARRAISQTVDFQELENLRRAIQFIDEYCKTHNKMDLPFILQIHKEATQGLPVGDRLPGDETPGKLRMKDVEITMSDHMPPMGVKVQDYMNALVEFMNESHSKQYYLLKTAILHHRFTWIHPFGNGNGRMARLLTYAALQLMGYGNTSWRIINPTAIFYADRQRYYASLACADKGTEAGILQWSEYFIGGLVEEINKIDRLLDKDYVNNKLIVPALKEAQTSERIGEREYQTLRGSLNEEEMIFASADINRYLGLELNSVARTRLIASLKRSGLIKPAWNAKQKYVIQVSSPLLIRYLLQLLEKEGFIHDVTE